MSRVVLVALDRDVSPEYAEHIGKAVESALGEGTRSLVITHCNHLAIVDVEDDW